MQMHQEWLEAKPSDGMDILYTGAHRNINMNGSYSDVNSCKHGSFVL